MTEESFWDIEEMFAEQYVRNPNSGELVQGHAIVLAELGIVPFQGKQVRDADLFSGSWNKQRRAAQHWHGYTSGAEWSYAPGHRPRSAIRGFPVKDRQRVVEIRPSTRFLKKS